MQIARTMTEGYRERAGNQNTGYVYDPRYVEYLADTVEGMMNGSQGNE